MSGRHQKTIRVWCLRPALAIALAILSPGQGLAQASSEMEAGSNDVTTTTATLGPVTVALQNNSDNPNGGTFAAIAAPNPTATLTIGNLQYANTTTFATNGVHIGDPTTAPATPRLPLMTAIGSPTDALYTSLPVVTAGSGITVTTNRGWYIVSRTRGPLDAGAAQTGRLQVADLTIDLSAPMSNVVLHIVGWGGTTGTKTFTTEFDLLTASSIGVTGFTKISGNGALAVSGTQAINALATTAASCVASPSAACGSVQVTGTAITRIVLRAYIRSNQAVAWSTTGSDAFVLGLSGEVSDVVPALGPIPATVQPGETYRGLSATCTNAGPNTARAPICALATSTGTVANLTCTGITGNALAPGLAATCTYDYTAPLSGSGVSNTVFTSTTGAPNDRDGGMTAGGNNAVTASRTLTDSPFSPGVPAGICSAIADRLPFIFTGVAGGTEAASYDLISHSPFSYNVGGKPVFMTGSGTVSTQAIATTPGLLFKPAELESATLPSIATTDAGRGEIVIITSRIVGRAGSAMTVRVSDSADDDHDVFTVETTAGAMLVRSPASGSNATNGDLVLAFTMPSGGVAYLRQYIADYGSAYGQRLDGGCLRTDLVTVKARSAPAGGSIEVGQSVTFTIMVTNNGPSDTSNLQLTDVMPSTLSGITAVASAGVFNGANGLWTIPALANGAAATLQLTGTATMAASNTTVTNTTTAAAGDQTDPTTTSDVLQASVLVLQAPQVTATKSVTLLSNSAANCGTRSSTPDAGVEAFTPGSCIEYVIDLTNPTSAVARDILMTDVLTLRLLYMAAAATGFDTSDPSYQLSTPATGTACGGPACTVRLDKARLPAGASGQIRIRAVLQ